jgi:cytochrome c oxidase subunit 4
MVFRTVPRALTSAGRFQSSGASSAASRRAYHQTNSSIRCVAARQTQNQRQNAASYQQSRSQTQHAIANPELAGIEKRWESMPPQEQAELWMKLRDRMKANWQDLTWQEKKAGA